MKKLVLVLIVLFIAQVGWAKPVTLSIAIKNAGSLSVQPTISLKDTLNSLSLKTHIYSSKDVWNMFGKKIIVVSKSSSGVKMDTGKLTGTTMDYFSISVQLLECLPLVNYFSVPIYYQDVLNIQEVK